MESVLRPGSTIDGQQRNFALHVRRGWTVDDLNRELEATREKRDTKAGREVVARYRPLLGDDKELDQYLQEVDASLELQELMDRLSSAQRGGRKAEARTLAEQILKRPGLPAELREALQRQVRGK
jgi:hypothetical protein